MVLRVIGYALTAMLVAPAIQAHEKVVIQSASDLPALVLDLPEKPSELVLRGGPGLELVRDQLEAYASTLLTDYKIIDKTTEKQLKGALALAALSQKRWNDALRFSEESRALEEKRSARLVNGLLADAYAQAALAVGEGSPLFRNQFESELTNAVATLDLAVTRDELDAMRRQLPGLRPDVLASVLRAVHDPRASAQKMKVGFETGALIVQLHWFSAEILPLKDIVLGVINKRLAAETAQKKDLWSHRLVELMPQEIQRPVTIAIWDSGFDPDILKGSLWRNLREKPDGRDNDANGYVDDMHGIASDTQYQRTSGALGRDPSGDLEELLNEQLKLSSDIPRTVGSRRAGASYQQLPSPNPKVLASVALVAARLLHYSHGTAVAFTSAEGNPGARLMHARMDRNISLAPTPFDEKEAGAMASYVRDTIGYFKEHGVRIANMSWRITEPQIAATLEAVEPDPRKRKERATAIFNTVSAALEESFRGAPNILFVAAAGNEDQDVDFVRSFPAGINLENVLTVGAVDVTLQPSGFTSFGKSIDLYANGSEVPTKAPKGKSIKVSGTSLAAPYVTNLAGKMLSLDPTLTVAKLRNIIEETATAEGERRLLIVNPAAALERVRQQATRR